MKKMLIENNYVTTNFDPSGGYPFDSGNGRKTMSLIIPKSINETSEEMLIRLARRGYKKITFYYTTTRVRGYYDLIAYAK